MRPDLRTIRSVRCSRFFWLVDGVLAATGAAAPAVKLLLPPSTARNEGQGPRGATKWRARPC
eukprot:14777001-Alexandrium_andersonii.AAC.1